MKRTKIFELLQKEHPKQDSNDSERVFIKGWIRTKRDSKGFSFVEINDGSCLANMQVIFDEAIKDYDQILKLTTGSAIEIFGKIIKSLGSGQKWEIVADKFFIIDLAPQSYPLQKKRHSDEFLRTIAHLRPRTNKYGAIFRIRSEASFAVHKFFHDKGFKYIHTPIVTGSDCEGAGKLFKVTTLDLNDNNKKDFSEDFFGKKAYLTVSGQLNAEVMALALGDVYTFGPTFRAENSNTKRHAAEFWMIEPEMAFCNLKEDMDLAEEFIKNVTSHVLDNCSGDISLFAKFVDKTLLSTLKNITSSKFKRLPYKDAIDILIKSNQKFEFNVEYGCDLQSEHERYLTEKHFKKPVILYDYPRNIKPFYMRVNDDNDTVAAMDVLFPRIGELIGGSQREERLDQLIEQMERSNIDQEDYKWYIELRKYGSVPHSGFGLGFERLLMLLTGVTNIRDVVPFPRTPGNIEF